MRCRHALFAALLPLATPAPAWEFSEDPVCTLSHATAEVAVAVTFDPSIPEYAIALTLAEGVWPEAAVFAIAFDGGWPITIRTDRHEIGDDGRRLTVRDSGFGNVLDGIGKNSRATAMVPGLAVTLQLDGAGGPLAAFRACPAPKLS